MSLFSPDSRHDAHSTSSNEAHTLHARLPTAMPTTITSSSQRKTKKTRLLIISDTHNTAPFPATDTIHAYREPLPAADILLHCGDLTNTGGLPRYRAALAMLSRAPAPLKLVIAGNHDMSLDGPFWEKSLQAQKQQKQWGRWAVRREANEHEEARALWTAPEARAAGIRYLDEGVHTFELENGARLVVYASPFQPEFCAWAFAYERGEDRFNPASASPAVSAADEAPDRMNNTADVDDYDNEPYTNIAVKPVPDFPHIDILMTHGPPKRRMDFCPGGFVGCAHLLRAARRARPRVHCFGHIHEGWGAEVVTWAGLDDGSGKGTEHVSLGPEQQGEGQNWEADGIYKVEEVRWDEQAAMDQGAAHVDISCEGERPLRFGEQTLMVNAAIMNGYFKPLNAPWLVDIDLPVVEE